MGCECSVNYLKLHPECIVTCLSHLSSNCLFLKITSLCFSSDPLPDLERPEVQVLGRMPKALVALAVFSKARREDFRGFRFSLKKAPEYITFIAG